MAWQYAAMAGFQLASGLQQAELVREQGKLTQQINEMNAQYAELDAYHSEQGGVEQEARYQTTIDQNTGAQRVALASANVDVTFGTASEIQAESKLTGFLNQIDIKNQAHERALGYTREARAIRSGSATKRLENDLRADSMVNAAIMNGVSGYVSNTASDPGPKAEKSTGKIFNVKAKGQ